MSYVTLEEANAIVAANFISSDSARVRWNTLSDDDKLILLNNAFQRIEQLPYTGRPTQRTQTTAFPRDGETVVGDVVKLAQVTEALLDFAITGVRSARSRGVKSFSIGHLSETYEGAESPNDPLSSVDSATRRLLRNYLAGGYRIC